MVNFIMRLGFVFSFTYFCLYSLVLQGKEFETRLKEKKPGDLSDDLKTALGMPTGAVILSVFVCFIFESVVYITVPLIL